MPDDNAMLDDAALCSLLCAVSSAAATACSPQQAMNGVVGALVRAGIARGGLVVVRADPPVVLLAGDATSLSLTGRRRRRRQNDPAGPDPLVLVQSIPVRACPRATLQLHLSRPLDPHVLRAITSQLALSLDRCHLDEQAGHLNSQALQRIEEVAAIYEIGSAMDRVEIGRLLEIITEKATAVMRAQACSLMRLNPETNSLTIAASYGLSEDIVVISQRALGEGLAGKVAQSGEPMLIDSLDDPNLQGMRLRPEIGSSMVVPMKDEQGSVIGVLSIRRRRPAPSFTQDDLRLISVFASQAALAISNKTLYDEQVRRVREISTISDLTQAIISHLDLPSLLDHVADNIVEVVKFDRCCIFLLDRHTRRYVPRILRGYPEEVIGRNAIKLGEGVIGIVARKRIPVVERDARAALQPLRGFARSLGVNAFLAIPIISRGQTIGVVLADNKMSGRTIQPEAVDLLTTFVNQAGIAIENAQLYEDREQRFQEINRLAAQTENILRSIAASVVVVDAAGCVTRWNKASEELWGVSEELAVQLSFVQLIDRFGLPRQEAHAFYNMRQQVRETGKPFQGYKLALHPAARGEIHVNILVSPLIDRQGEQQGIVLVVEDVTRETRMESEMDRMRRLADIGQLAAKMAHEVRNPLSSIKGAAQLMRNEHEDQPSLREFLDIIIDEVNGLSRITTDMLDFARPMQLEPVSTSLNELVERTLSFLSALLEEHGVHAEISADPSLPEMLGDPRQIEQVMRNIVINAAQAMPDGGTLRVATTHDPAERTVTARFADTGMGIAEDKLEEVFQPFVTTKTKGTGLGLAIASRIVENHGGRIEAESQAGEGTTFSITFPVRPDTTSAFKPLPVSLSLPDR